MNDVNKHENGPDILDQQLTDALSEGAQMPAPADLTSKLKTAIDTEISAAGAVSGLGASAAKGAGLALGLVGIAAVLVFSTMAISGKLGGRQDPSSVESGSPSEAATPEDRSTNPGSLDAPSDRDPNEVAAPSPADFASSDENSDASVELDGPLLTGIVTDLDGTPLAGAAVHLERYGSRVRFARTDDEGRYALSLAPVEVVEFDDGRSQLHMGLGQTADAFISESPVRVGRRLKADEEAIIEMLDRDGKAASVKVNGTDTLITVDSTPSPTLVEARDAAANLEAISRELEARRAAIESAARAAAKSDAASTEAGWQRLEELKKEADRVAMEIDRSRSTVRPFISRPTFAVSVLIEGYEAPLPRNVVVPEEGSVEENFELAIGERVHGVVVDADGNPVANAMVRVAGSIDSETANVAAQSTTDESGRFHFGSLAAGMHLLAVTSEEHPRLESLVSTGSDPVTLRLTEGGRLRVRVEDESGKPVRWARVGLSRDGVTLANLGTAPGKEEVEFAGLPIGEHLLRVYRSKGRLPDYEGWVDVTAEGEELSVVLAEPVPVEGRLDLPSEESAESVQGKYLIVAYRADGDFSQHSAPMVYSDADGNFRFDSLAPGSYQFGIATQRERRWGIRCIDPVEIHSAGAATQVVRLRYEETPHGSLEVTAHDADGNPIAKAAVTMRRTTTRGQATRYTDQDGVYTLDLHPDLFDLWVGADGYTTDHFTDLRVGSGETRKIDVTLYPKPDLAEHLEPLARSEATISVRQPVSLAALLEMVEAVEPGLFVVDDALAESTRFEDKKVGPIGSVPPFVALIEAIRRANLDTRLDRNQLVLGLPAPTGRTR